MRALHRHEVTERQLIERLKRDGWYLERVRGSHHVYLHPAKPGIVVVPRHGKGRDVPFGILRVILKKAGLQ